MSEVDSELVEVKREVVEARNQAIKTDNQIKNLSLDIRGFEKRFDTLEKRTRMASVAVYVIVALTVALASYFAYSVQLGRLHGQIAAAQEQADAVKQRAAERVEQARAKLAELEQARARREKAAAALTRVLDHLEAGRKKKAVGALQALNVEHLSSVTQRLADEQLHDLRVDAAETAYRKARKHISADRHDKAVKLLRRYRALDPEGSHAAPARYLLAVQLWKSGRYDQMLPILDELEAEESDERVLDEADYFRAAALAHLGQRDKAQKLFADIAEGGGRHASPARKYLSALESGSPLPDTKE